MSKITNQDRECQQCAKLSLIFKVISFYSIMLLTTFSMPSPALGPWSTEVRKKTKAIPTFLELMFWKEEQDNKQ